MYKFKNKVKNKMKRKWSWKSLNSHQNKRIKKIHKWKEKKKVKIFFKKFKEKIMKLRL
jgi:hypothetical protein